MTKYHIKRETGRPNICRADPSNPKSRGCPYKNDDGTPVEHYATKEEARAAYEKSQSAQVLSKTLRKPTVNKTVAIKGNEVNPLFMQDEMAFASSVIDDSTDYWFKNKEVIVDGFLEAVYEHPGCSGCQPPYSDYCRCGTYTGEVTKDTNKETAFYYSKIFKDASITYDSNDNKFYNQAKGMKPKPVDIDTMEDLVKIRVLLDKYKPLESQDMQVKGSYNYYGENLEMFKPKNKEMEQTKIKLFAQDFKKLYEI